MGNVFNCSEDEGDVPEEDAPDEAVPGLAPVESHLRGSRQRVSLLSPLQLLWRLSLTRQRPEVAAAAGVDFD